jgi:hypothetical protein
VKAVQEHETDREITDSAHIESILERGRQRGVTRCDDAICGSLSRPVSV